MFFDQDPHISFLWFGAIITGAQKSFLKQVFGLIGLNRIDLHAATWTDTLLSFVQEPVKPLPLESNSISRADGCRLMFLAQEPPRDFPPIYPYPPLGCTAIKDTDLGVRPYAHCPGHHVLRSVSVTWNCAGGRKVTQTTGPVAATRRSRISNTVGSASRTDTEIEVDYSYMDRERHLSVKVTGNLFRWMREMDGYTTAEKNTGIYRHDWVYRPNDDGWDDDDAPVEGDGTSTAGRDFAPHVGRWIASTLTKRCNSV